MVAHDVDWKKRLPGIAAIRPAIKVQPAPQGGRDASLPRSGHDSALSQPGDENEWLHPAEFSIGIGIELAVEQCSLCFFVASTIPIPILIPTPNSL